MGAKILSEFNAPTVTYHYRAVYTLVASASGIWSGTFLCHPFAHLMLQTGTVTGQANSPYSANSELFYPLTPAALYTKMASWRVVGGGWKIKNNQPFNTIQGDIQSAMLPGVQNSWCTTQLLNGAAGGGLTNNMIEEIINGQQLSGGVDWGGLLLSMPDAKSLSATALIKSDLKFNCRPFEPKQVGFKASQYERRSADNTEDIGIADEIVDATGVVVSAAMGTNVVSTDGYPTYAMYAEGLPNNSAFAKAEFVMHIEGPPVLTLSSVPQLLADEADAVETTPNFYDKIARRLRETDWISLVDIGLRSTMDVFDGDLPRRRYLRYGEF